VRRELKSGVIWASFGSHFGKSTYKKPAKELPVMKMDQKIMGAIVVSILAFAGLAFAVPIWQKNSEGQNETARWQEMANQTQHGNSTDLLQFRQALSDGDFAAAKKLHDDYGFGGPLFGKLNESTFAKYAEISKLSQELRQELGMNATGMEPPMMGGFGRGGRAMGRGQEFEGNETGKGQPPRLGLGANATGTDSCQPQGFGKGMRR
jgi:hypothetical protein